MDFHEEMKQRLKRTLRGGKGERSVYHEAARMLLSRGFDVVVFGHTHQREDVTFEPGLRYVNCGNWVRGGSYVQIEGGEVALRRWGEEG